MQTQKQPLFLIVRIVVCIAAVGFTLFTYIDKQNELTELRLAIPALKKKLSALQQDNLSLEYQIEQFENPANLMKVMRQPEFSHLKYPYINEEIILPKAPLPSDGGTP